MFTGDTFTVTQHVMNGKCLWSIYLIAYWEAMYSVYFVGLSMKKACAHRKFPGIVMIYGVANYAVFR